MYVHAGQYEAILSSDPHSTYEGSAMNTASLMIVILSNGELSPLV